MKLIKLLSISVIMALFAASCQDKPQTQEPENNQPEVVKPEDGKPIELEDFTVTLTSLHAGEIGRASCRERVLRAV